MSAKIKTIPKRINFQKLLDDYDYLDITEELDNLQGDFSQNILNEIVLWKVNRYARFEIDVIEKLNLLPQKKIDKGYTTDLLVSLMNIKGVKLAMASTILRFKCPELYQIIDQRVYRVLYGKPLKNSTVHSKMIELYFKYLKDLRKVCDELNVPFEKADRIFYMLDKDINKSVKIK